MNALAITILVSLSLAAFFVIGFSFERRARKKGPSLEHDALLPMADDAPLPTEEDTDGSDRRDTDGES